MNGLTLYASDLDGTLLNPEAQLSEGSVELLNRAIVQNGALFTVATARTPATVVPLMREVEMRMPAVVMTGAAWWHFDKKCFSHERYIQPEHAALIIDLFRRHSVSPFVYTISDAGRGNMLDVFYNNGQPSEPDRKFIEQRIKSPLKNFVFTEVTPQKLDKIFLFFASGDKDRLTALADSISALTRCSVSCYDDVYNPGLGLIEVFAEGVSKAAALQEMKRHYEIDKMVVFGDNLNDVPMFEIADRAVAVANASQQVRSRADVTIGDNTTDSVARYVFLETKRN